MKKLLESNADTVAVLAGLALAFGIIGVYVLSITQIAASFDRAINPSEVVVPMPAYRIEAAGELDLRGLTPGR